MWWRHAGVHRARFRELVAGEGLSAELVPEPIRITCPRCGDWYFADLGPEEPEPWDLERVSEPDLLHWEHEHTPSPGRPLERHRAALAARATEAEGWAAARA